MSIFHNSKKALSSRQSPAWDKDRSKAINQAEKRGGLSKLLKLGVSTIRPRLV